MKSEVALAVQQGERASELARRAADILRKRGVDGRLIEALSADGLLNGLFAENPCPSVDRYAFFSTPCGERWLYVEREGVGRKGSYIIATGNMGGQGDSITISGLGIVEEKVGSSRGSQAVTRSYDEGALFIDLLSTAKGTLTIDRRIDEAEFISHTRPDLWAGAARFDSGVAPAGFAAAPALEAVPVEDDDEDDGQGTDDDEGADTPPISTGTEAFFNGATATARD